jgi:hypothetical protein
LPHVSTHPAHSVQCCSPRHDVLARRRNAQRLLIHLYRLVVFSLIPVTIPNTVQRCCLLLGILSSAGLRQRRTIGFQRLLIVRGPRKSEADFIQCFRFGFGIPGRLRCLEVSSVACPVFPARDEAAQ